jgi:signal transduction histidine kinase
LTIVAYGITGVLLLITLLLASEGNLRVVLAMTFVCFCLSTLLAANLLPSTPGTATPPDRQPAVAVPPEPVIDINDHKLSAINQFASLVSHELRNPLSSLKNIAYFFSKTPSLDDEKSQRMLQLLSGEIDRTNDMITNLLDMSRVRKVTRKSARLDTVIEQAIAASPRREEITVIRHLEALDAVVDPDKFVQLVKILLANAREAIPGPGTITVTLRRQAAVVILTVTDSGTGMDTTVLNKAFEPLFTTKTKALGMGLTIAREIARIHSGTVTIISEQDKGTSVTVTLSLPAELVTPTIS